MEEKRKIRMPIGAAVACLLIVALLTVGIVAGAKFINNSNLLPQSPPLRRKSRSLPLFFLRSASTMEGAHPAKFFCSL